MSLTHWKYKTKIEFLDISNYPYDDQLEMIKENPKAIEYISQPSFQLCLEAMYINPRVFYKIKRNHPRHNELLEFYRYLRV
jgi:hypothetical protein